MITLYTTDCPQCKVLESMLKNANIEFEVCDNVEKMVSLGMTSAPNLEVCGQILNYQQALMWLREVRA